jgi:hypothetical protein
MSKLKELYTFKSEDKTTMAELTKKYNFENGFEVGIKHDQFINEGFANTLIVFKLRGEYPNFEREPKFKGILKDRYKKFVEVVRGKYQEVEL